MSFVEWAYFMCRSKAENETKTQDLKFNNAQTTSFFCGEGGERPMFQTKKRLFVTTEKITNCVLMRGSKNGHFVAHNCFGLSGGFKVFESPLKNTLKIGVSEWDG